MTYPCILCDADLYPTDVRAVCSFCGQEARAEYVCPNGHFICEECQLADLPAAVARVCAGTADADRIGSAKM